ncbi:hypothetical protein [Acetomicrobium hydrogeniformans]|uniref:hypothetical protein n=1 Tax=Acetomicrobium hydrogeniformans TaxID=649746 RepID=UPI00103DD472|nr:hypothetical protein [Acetomicrobium hydrogeniformans]
MDKYCPNCKRMVGVKKNMMPGIITIVVGLLIALFLPFVCLIVGAPVALVGVVLLILGGSKCSICGSKT